MPRVTPAGTTERGVAITRQEAVERILSDLGTAIERTAISLACLGGAFEVLTAAPGERLEDELYRPVQKCFGRGQRAHSHFAERTGNPTVRFDLPEPGVASQGARAYVERAVVAAANADRALSELQDTMLPIEFGDAELRAALAEMRELLAPLPLSAREFLRTLGR